MVFFVIISPKSPFTSLFIIFFLNKKVLPHIFEFLICFSVILFLICCSVWLYRLDMTVGFSSSRYGVY